MMHYLEKIYPKLPVIMQNLSCSLYGLQERRIRMGSEFKKRYNWLIETDYSIQDDIICYQNEQLQRIVNHAYSNVPYYKEIMEKEEVNPKDIKSVVDLKKLPVLKKEDVVNNYKKLIALSYPGNRLKKSKTSGTTGTALKFYLTNESIPFQWAVWWRHRARFSVYPFMKHLNFTGKLVVPIEQVAPPYWRWNIPMNQALINMQHLKAENTTALINFVNNNDFKFYSGYPSIIYQFANLLNENGLELVNKPDYIFLGAENTQDYQKKIIQKITNLKVTDQYGISEGCANASRCEYDLYHEDWEFCILECGDKEILPDGSIRGKIIATGFSNYGFPFIRYETGDMAIWAPEDYRCKCGRDSRVIFKIEGRNEDYIITPEGTSIMRFDYLFKDTNTIKEVQVRQHKLGSIIIRLVPRPGFTKNDQERIRQRVKELISPKLTVEFEVVDLIPKSASGKFRPVVSEVERT